MSDKEKLDKAVSDFKKATEKPGFEKKWLQMSLTSTQKKNRMSKNHFAL